MDDNKAKGPAQNGKGNRGGNGFSFDEPKRGDRDGRGGRGGDRRGGRDGGSGSYRVVNELSAVEKALTKADFAAMKEPLTQVLRAIKPLRLASLDKLDQGARGKLITSLMRVQRLAKPADEAAPAADAPAEAAAPTESAPAEGAPAEGTASAEAPPTPAAEAAPAPAAEPKSAAYNDVQFTVGLIWSAVNDAERAKTAFENAGRQPSEADLAMPPAPPPSEKRERPERGARGPRADRGERRERRDRPERVEKKPRFERPEPFVSSGDWQADVKKLEELGRTRDAGRIHEKNQSYADAARLYEKGGDVKSALRNAALGKLDEMFTRLSAGLNDAEIVEALERASAFEKLMEFHVGKGNFEEIAKLYERAGQFDQAGLAFERAGKFSFARKAYERAKDFGAANRVRELEVKKLLERGDVLGAATLLVAANKKAEALEAIKPLPGPKAYHFMQKLKLNAEAEAFAQAELAKAEAENNGLQKARWLELLGKQQEAADLYLSLDRKDKAAYVFEAMGQLGRAAELLEAAGQLDKAQALFEKAKDTANAERVKALPRPEPKAKPAADALPPPEAVAGEAAKADASANA